MSHARPLTVHQVALKVNNKTIQHINFRLLVNGEWIVSAAQIAKFFFGVIERTAVGTFYRNRKIPLIKKDAGNQQLKFQANEGGQSQSGIDAANVMKALSHALERKKMHPTKQIYLEKLSEQCMEIRGGKYYFKRELPKSIELLAVQEEKASAVSALSAFTSPPVLDSVIPAFLFRAGPSQGGGIPMNISEIVSNAKLPDVGAGNGEAVPFFNLVAEDSEPRVSSPLDFFAHIAVESSSQTLASSNPHAIFNAKNPSVEFKSAESDYEYSADRQHKGKNRYSPW